MAETAPINDTAPSEDPADLVEDPAPPDESAAAAEDEEHAEEQLDPEVAARRDAALALVRKWGDPVLRQRARPVERFDEALREEIARMGALMSDSLGIGLAATQLGRLTRVLVYRVQPQAPISSVVNPEIEWRGRDEEGLEEGCLSLPDVNVEVSRPVHIRVRAQDGHGEPLLIEASGLEARVLQHEIDHLDGVLILDRTTREQKKSAIRSLREWQAAQDAA